jgi:pyridoxamine 5'-phosphate oxidase
VAVHDEPLDEADVDRDPLAQFRNWFAAAAEVVRLPEAAAVATADAAGHPSVRMVLVKAWDGRGFVFHTDYDSRKGQELAANPQGALLFHWDPLGRQVRLEGPVERLSPEESDCYFQTRPRGGQIGAHASDQSRPIGSRSDLDTKVAEVATRYEGGPVPRPASWGGFLLRPEVYEFWQNRDDRLHDRIRYRRRDDGWVIDRLQP